MLGLEIGQKLGLSCSVSKGSKPLSFVWLKDGVALSQDKYRITNDDDFSHLKVDPVSATDAGNYTCKASNAFGSDSHLSEVHIKRKLPFACS